MMFKYCWWPVLVLAMHVSNAAAAETASAPKADAPTAKQAAPAAAPAFNILEFQVDGNTVLGQTDIERAVYSFLGEGKTLKDVEGAQHALEKAYHDRGYLTVLVNIPPQHVGDGIVHLNVVEATVGKLRITGSRYHSLDEIRETVPALTEGAVPNFKEVQKELTTLNRGADRRVTPVLRASETPGRVDVELQVNDELPLHANLKLNNYYSPNTDHLRAIAEVRDDNLFQLEHSLDFQYQTAPGDPRDVRVWSLSYAIPTSGAAVWALYAVHSDSNVSVIGDLDVLGKGDVYGVRLIEPLPGGSTRFYQSLSGGADYKDFKQNLVLQGSDTVPTPIRYLPFSLQYSGTWLQLDTAQKEQGATAVKARSSTTFTAGITFTLRGVLADGDQFNNKRYGASASFLVFRPGLQRLQALPYGWSLFGKIDGQLASGPLISNEQFASGGIESVRGYEESERLGDDGAHVTAELRTPGLLGSLSPRIEESYLFAFADAAKLQVRDALPTQDSRFSLASCGLGYRLKAGDFTLSLDGAHALLNGADTGRGANRGLFEVSYGF
jgi:hemolysin activation/secretion protein